MYIEIGQRLSVRKDRKHSGREDTLDDGVKNRSSGRCTNPTENNHADDMNMIMLEEFSFWVFLSFIIQDIQCKHLIYLLNHSDFCFICFSI